jgi:hypothetical protein
MRLRRGSRLKAPPDRKILDREAWTHAVVSVAAVPDMDNRSDHPIYGWGMDRP